MNVLAAVLLLAAAPPAVQAPPARTGEDPLARHLFPPELVMKHGAAVGLGEEQRDTIKTAIQDAQGRFLDLQWAMQEAVGAMEQLLQAQPVDETAVLTQLDAILDIERRIKRAQFSLLVRIKNTLEPSQQQRLEQLR